MYPSQHVALTSLALVPLRERGWSLPRLGLFAAGAVLIDVDHYLSYAIKSGDWSLPNAYRWHVRRVPPMARRRPRLYLPKLVLDRHRPFHAVAPIALLFFLAWGPFPALRNGGHNPGDAPPGALRWLFRCFRPWLRCLAWGVLFHRLCDYAIEIFEYRPGIPTDAPSDSRRGLPKRPSEE